jgi:hypothetical protein
MQEGQWYLFAVPWDWTFVGQFVRHVSRDEIAIRNGGYFTRTGATFDRLCRDGFTPETKFHDCSDLGEIIIPAQGPKFPWRAATPWLKGNKGGKS